MPAVDQTRAPAAGQGPARMAHLLAWHGGYGAVGAVGCGACMSVDMYVTDEMPPSGGFVLQKNWYRLVQGSAGGAIIAGDVILY